MRRIGSIRIVREITDVFSLPALGPLPSGARVPRTVMSRTIVRMFILTWMITVSTVSGQDGAPEDPSKPLTLEPSNEPSLLFQAFSKTMTDVVLVGHFTMDNSPEPLKEERYEIDRVVKASQGDYWRFQARIKYGKYDVTLPLPLEVKWADKTPVITLDNVTIPGLGTFSARVIIDGTRYAGTWTHGEVGGHMFGKIEKKNPTK